MTPEKIFCAFALWFIAIIPLHAQTQTGKLVWRHKTGDRIIATPQLDDQNIYYGSTDGYVYCNDQKSGKLQWKVNLGNPIRSSAAIGDGKIFSGCEDGNIYALNAKTGAIEWAFKTKGEKVYDLWDYYRSSPCYHQGKIFVGSGDGNIYCINAADGKERWHFSTGGVVHADPVFDKDMLYIGSFDGYFYALDADNGRLLWKFKTIGDRYFPKGEIQKAALVTHDALYFGSRDFNLYALDKKTGTGLWNMKESGSWIIATPLEKDGKLFFGTSDSHVFYSLGSFSGETQWKTSIPLRSYDTPAAYDTLVFAGCYNGYVYGFGQKTGKITWSFQTDGSKKNYASVYDTDGHFRKDFSIYGDDATTQASEQKILDLGSILSAPVIKDGMVYFGSTDGNLYAVRI